MRLMMFFADSVKLRSGAASDKVLVEQSTCRVAYAYTAA